MATRKKKAWNTDKVLFPGLQDPDYVHEPPKPMPITFAHLGQSTPDMSPNRVPEFRRRARDWLATGGGPGR